MEIRNTFAVDAPPATVFDALVDLERVGPCIPGATIGAAADDGSHPARIAVKLGPMRMTYAGRVRIVEQDPAARRAVLEADVKEARGQGTARARMTMDVAAADGAGASVASVTAVQISGRAAQMGAGIIEDVAGRLVEQMASNLSAQLASEPKAPEPARGSTATSASEPAADPTAAAATERSAAHEPAAASSADRAGGTSGADPGSLRTGSASIGTGPARHGAPGSAEAKPLNGFALLLKVLAARVKRLFKKEPR